MAPEKLYIFPSWLQQSKLQQIWREEAIAGGRIAAQGPCFPLDSARSPSTVRGHPQTEANKKQQLCLRLYARTKFGSLKSPGFRIHSKGFRCVGGAGRHVHKAALDELCCISWFYVLRSGGQGQIRSWWPESTAGS